MIIKVTDSLEKHTLQQLSPVFESMWSWQQMSWQGVTSVLLLSVWESDPTSQKEHEATVLCISCLGLSFWFVLKAASWCR